jgi:adenylylsulfate kinase-like enzyme
MSNQTGTVFWLTGLSGSGKTTIATELTQSLRNLGHPVILLDGDNLREIIGNTENHERHDRLKSSLLYARFCHLLAKQNIHVVCATISLFHETQNWNRNNISHYLEIFIDTPLSEVIKRDSKKIYSRAHAGELSNVVGVDILPEYPKQPDLVIKNTDNSKINVTVEKILTLFNSKNYVKGPLQQSVSSIGQ